MANQLVTLDSAGDNPTVVITVGGPSFCIFTLFLKGPASNEWVQLFEGDNREAQDQAGPKSVYKLLLDPRELPGAQPVGTSLRDFEGWRVGWLITFKGFSDNEKDAYDITLGIYQQQGAVMLPEFAKAGEFDGPAKSFNGYVTLNVV